MSLVRLAERAVEHAPDCRRDRAGKVERIDNYLATACDDGMQSFDESMRLLYNVR